MGGEVFVQCVVVRFFIIQKVLADACLT